MEQNFAFCEWKPYIGTAPEQKAKNANPLRNSMFLRGFNIFIIMRCGVPDAPYGNIFTVTYYKFGVVLTTLSTDWMGGYYPPIVFYTDTSVIFSVKIHKM